MCFKKRPGPSNYFHEPGFFIFYLLFSIISASLWKKLALQCLLPPRILLF
jgi:hypothetical protein